MTESLTPTGSAPAQQSRFVKNSIIALSASVLNTVLGFASSILISRLLGPEGRGEYVLILTISTFILRFFNFGIGDATTFYIGKRTYPQQDIIATALFGDVIASLFGAGLLLAFASIGKFSYLADIDFKWLVVIAAMAIPTLVMAHLYTILLALDQVGDYGIANLLLSISSLGLIAILVGFGKLGLSGAIFAWVISTLVVNAFTLYKAIHKIGALGKVQLPILNRLLHYGLFPYSVSVLQLLCLRIDVFFVKGFNGLAAVGFYTLAVSIAELIWQLPNSISIILFPRLSKLEVGEENSVTPIVSRVITGLMACGLLGLLFFGRIFITLVYGVEYSASVLPLQLLLPGILSYGIGKILFNDMMARGKAKTGVYSAVVNLLVILVLDLTLIPLLGINGAAVASSIAYTAGMIVILVGYLHTSGQSIQKTLVLQRSDIRMLFLIFKQAFGGWITSLAQKFA